MSERTKKLIEVALPLDEINIACKADKDRKTGTIRNLHKWFAPMPLPAWRALIYAALIDDPSDDEQRARHLELIKRLVANGADLPDEESLNEARNNLAEQYPEGLPAVLDPFSGGGSTLVEAQRLGLSTHGSDLNPVPVLITRTLTELLPKAWGGSPVYRRGESTVSGQTSLAMTVDGSTNIGLSGLIEDVRSYATQIRDESWRRLGHIYPAQPGERPVAWLWAHTVLCPNPACGIETVLASTWWLSKKPGSMAWIQPHVVENQIELEVVDQQATGNPLDSPKSGRGTFQCVRCGAAIDEKFLRSEGKSQRLGQRMTAVVVEIDGERRYREPTNDEVEAAFCSGVEVELPDIPLVGWATKNAPLYGIETWDRVFTKRQLVMLGTFAELIAEVHQEVIRAGGSQSWADSVATLLALALGNMSTASSTQVRWRQRESAHSKAEPAFGRNDLPMMWDFAETSPWGDSVGDWMGNVAGMCRALRYVPSGHGSAMRADARTTRLAQPGLVATDPPYFDAIGYADLSDYFYIWHRRALRNIHPDLYSTVAAPKQGELTAISSHHGNNREAARRYFVEGFTETFKNLQASLAPDLPLLVVYASKEQKGGREEETRWSSILTAMVDAGLEITGTWPIHGTGSSRMVGMGANAVASYVVMAARPRAEDAATCSLQDLNRALRRELKPAVEHLQSAGILPVDLAQAAMGPGMQIYSRYRAVLDQTGNKVTVDLALRLINQALGEVLDEQEGELDPDSRFAVTWWESNHWGEASFGEADQLARPKGISVDDVVRAGVAVYPRPGFVSVIGAANLDRAWSPSSDVRPTAWEAVHHLADRLIEGEGVASAGALLRELGPLRDQAQGLVYRLHAIAARKGWTKDQERYNSLIGSWSDLLAEAGRSHTSGDGLF